MNLLQRFKDGASRVTEKAQNSVEIGKLNSRISDIEHEMELEFMKMGKLFYEGYRSRDLSLAEGKMTEISRLCSKLQEEIDSVRLRIAELKNERLCKCGHIVALDANFCPSCGRKLEEETGVGKAPSSGGYSVRKEDVEETRVYKAEGNLVKEPEPEPELQINYEEILEHEEELPLPLEDYAGGIQDSMLDHQHGDELERERERQLELDRRIRDWKASEYVEAEREGEGGQDLVKCQICRADLPKGSMWCPRCGSEQI
ncbi:zinc ribbon domain-containing protein [Paenibacillus sp. BR2-3]|uniref:zinc ribbon domain-containing protein n=1 Tax=Paenibacillus sp. BR2-3 TaxID=3048494 RepID=UPI003977DAEA